MHQRISFGTKLWLALALMWTGLLAVSVESAIDAHQRVLTERRQGLHNILDVAIRIAESYQERVARGELTEDDAKKAVLTQWELMRFHGSGYVYAFTRDYVLLLNPGKPRLVGKSVENLTDAVGRRPYVELAALARTNDTGHVAAFDRLVDRTLAEKISAARPLPGWDWVVAAKLYVEDVNTTRRKLIIARLAWTLSVGLFSTFLMVLIIGGVQRHVGHDHLTRLLNRKGFDRRMASALTNSRAAERELALFLIDLDGFKAVNDSHGHAAGDALLKMCAVRIQSAVRATDAVARFGGDEFAVIAQGISSIQTAERIAQTIVSAMSEPYLMDGQRVACSASVGIALNTTRHCTTQHELFRQADAALYMAKRAGKNQFIVYDTTEAGAANTPQDGARVER
ncbi:diguanylate cyclase [Cupriavidus sp. WKF15]|uniref:diguanylate cyclase domain-containing protein n=1 Tax=Cupriavidus sp. WKF15 TaxID=3032282 RepID=UPI0023E15030|nr:diguanylate cyclase [Cupriavidus sp. WKF15]WER47984.1 diguanylate cyclase [Cupriavidus sp. WKF15]